MLAFSIVVGSLIWFFAYLPYHDKMPWSYKNYIKKRGISN